MTKKVSPAEAAAAQQLVADGREIAALVMQNVQANADRYGRRLDRADLGLGIAPLLSAAWMLAKSAHADEDLARRLYVALLRRHADGVEGLG